MQVLPIPAYHVEADVANALRWTHLAGALVDFGGAVSFLFLPVWVEVKLELPKQVDFWPKYAAVFLVVLTVLYVVSARNPARSLPNVGVALFGRTLGAVFYFGWCLYTRGIQWQLALFALMNVAFVVAYWRILGAAGRAELRDALQWVKL